MLSTRNSSSVVKEKLNNGRWYNGHSVDMACGTKRSGMNRDTCWKKKALKITLIISASERHEQEQTRGREDGGVRARRSIV